MHAQSAIEYLATYGWAILILAIALGVLYFLGVFNSNAYTAKASPYSCTVSRPYGPNSTAYMTLSGVCDNEVPEYVAKFNGYTSSINMGNGFGSRPAAISVTLWIYPSNVPPGEELPFTDEWAQQVSWGNSGCSGGGGCIGGTTNGGDWIYDPIGLPTGKWYFIALTGSNSIGDILYINGIEVASNTLGTVTSGGSSIWMGSTGEANGGAGCCNYAYYGDISNVQIYNISLSANDIHALYLEGIGGAPIDLPNLVGWWQLNGNSNDTSGNLNNGVSNNVIFTNTWYNTYS